MAAKADPHVVLSVIEEVTQETVARAVEEAKESLGPPT
jgi:hypothetical protein